jgi:hypothetical protein
MPLSGGSLIRSFKRRWTPGDLKPQKLPHPRVSLAARTEKREYSANPGFPGRKRHKPNSQRA